MKIIFLFKKVLLFLILISCFWLFKQGAYAITLQECETKANNHQLSLDDAQECEKILNTLYQQASDQKVSLISQIQKFNTAIAITNSKIYTTNQDIVRLEKEIDNLAVKIDKLDTSLDQLSEIFIKKVAQMYKNGRIDPIFLFLTSNGFSDFVNRYKYLKTAQVNDKKIMVQMETTKTSFETQKTLKKEKQDELALARKKLEAQKYALSQQIVDKNKLLEATKNDEKKYQQLLAITRAELDAIQGIIAGRGEETEVGGVGQGSRVASIINGASVCSTGTHLHFEVRDGDNVKNPLTYLKNENITDYSGGDPHNGTGDWDWPINLPIRFNQGFGSDTSAIRSRIVWYNFHTGIDLASNDLTVKAIKNGTLYRGSIACGSGTLRYVRLHHSDSNLDTYYLHVNY